MTTTTTITKRIAGAALIGGLALTFAACSSEPEPETPSAEVSEAPAEENAAAEAEPAGLTCQEVLSSADNADEHSGTYNGEVIQYGQGFDRAEAANITGEDSDVSVVDENVLLVGFSQDATSGISADTLESVTLYEDVGDGLCEELEVGEPTDYVLGSGGTASWAVTLEEPLEEQTTYYIRLDSPELGSTVKKAVSQNGLAGFDEIRRERAERILQEG